MSGAGWNTQGAPSEDDTASRSVALTLRAAGLTVGARQGRAHDAQHRGLIRRKATRRGPKEASESLGGQSSGDKGRRPPPHQPRESLRREGRLRVAGRAFPAEPEAPEESDNQDRMPRRRPAPRGILRGERPKHGLVLISLETFRDCETTSRSRRLMTRSRRSQRVRGDTRRFEISRRGA